MVTVAPEFSALFKTSKLYQVFIRAFTNLIEDKGRFGTLLATGRKRKAWEVERDHYYFTNKVLEKDNHSKDKVIEMLREEVKYFDQQKEQL